MSAAGDFREARLLIEAVHHACSAGDLDAAAKIMYNRVYQGPSAHFTYVLGGYETALDTLLDFYPLRDPALDPRLENADARRWILHETAACFHVLGQLSLASELGNRAAAAAIAVDDQHNAAISYHNLAESHLASGALASCRSVALDALRLAITGNELEDQLVAYTILGHLDHLGGRERPAEENFRRALEIAVESTSVPLLYSLSGVRYANHLRALGRVNEAAEAIRANVEFCQSQNWQSDAALALAQLATLNILPDAEALASASEAVSTARTIGAKQTLAQTLLARAAVALRSGQLEMAQTDLAEVLSNAQPSGYRLIEAETRITRAMLSEMLGEPVTAVAEAELALQLSHELGYEVGARRARVVLHRLQS